MTYDYELILIDQTYTEDENEDEVGNQIPTETETTILCGKKSVTRSEFYNAAINGLKPEIVLVVHTYEYTGQTKVEFEGVRYKVIRSYELNAEELELTCERVAADG